MPTITLNTPQANDNSLKQLKEFAKKALMGEYSSALNPDAARLFGQIVESIEHQKVFSDDDVLSTIQAAQYLHVSRPHLVKLLKKGEMPFFMVETHHRVKFQDLEVYRKRREAISDVAMPKQTAAAHTTRRTCFC
jgi:excisionase family DNA binding protein